MNKHKSLYITKRVAWFVKCKHCARINIPPQNRCTHDGNSHGTKGSCGNPMGMGTTQQWGYIN